jgi:hypothetical protein
MAEHAKSIDITDVVADLFGFHGAIIAVAAVTALSGWPVAVWMEETRWRQRGATMA